MVPFLSLFLQVAFFDIILSFITKESKLKPINLCFERVFLTQILELELKDLFFSNLFVYA